MMLLLENLKLALSAIRVNKMRSFLKMCIRDRLNTNPKGNYFILEMAALRLSTKILTNSKAPPFMV